jgi:uncharacterized protein (TIGR00369 family)
VGESGFDPSEVRLDAGLGLRLERADETGAVLRFDPTSLASVDADIVYLHGGALATCVDSAAWYAVDAARPDADWLVTDLRLDFLRLARVEPHVVRATVQRAGRTLAVVDVEIAPESEPGLPVALGRVSLLGRG